MVKIRSEVIDHGETKKAAASRLGQCLWQLLSSACLLSGMPRAFVEC